MYFARKATNMSKNLTAEGKNILKNMLITVTTTVVGATAVYLLGFNNKKSGPSRLEQEEITIDAWKTYVTLENIYTKNSVSIMRDLVSFGSFKTVYDESIKESDKFVTSVQRLSETEGIDKELKSMFERRIENENKSKPVVSKYFSDMDQLIDKGVDNGWTEQQTQDSINVRTARFTQETNGVMNRSITDIEGMAKILSERYDHDFDINDFLSIQIHRQGKDPFSILEDEKKAAEPGKISQVSSAAGGTLKDSGMLPDKVYLAGEWDANGAIITFHENGDMSWFVPADKSEVKGSWVLTGTKLSMDVTNQKTKKKAKWEFNLANVQKDVFNMVLVKEPFNMYRLARK